ncbi:MAG: aminoacetone oxidase family FAD-binding enzyme [Candidatus Omnitrophota bacterium]
MGMPKFHTGVIGAGASGMAAAISAKRAGKSVILFERMPSIGKKLLACGGGRCNFLNKKLDETYYNSEAKGLVKSIFACFGKKDILDFFDELGLYSFSEEDRIFPVTNQASTVLKALEIELKKLGACLELSFEVSGISLAKEGFLVASSVNNKAVCENLIMAGGGKSYPALGSNGGCYRFCREFGHRIIEPVPSAVAIEVEDRLCHLLQGQKVSVSFESVIDGKTISKVEGELLFTKYGLSGTAVLDVSRDLSIALNRRPARKAEALVDFVPFLEERALKNELARRINNGIEPEDLLCGILPNKFGMALSGLLKAKQPEKIAAELKHKNFRVIRTRGWNEAEFTCGGVDTTQVKPETLESRLKNGLYFCGEILDVDGKRGGYNLAWAFSSGFIAGLTK